jgi:hypothetical protein
MVMWDPAKIRREKDKEEEESYNPFKRIAKRQEERKQKEAIEKSKMAGDTIGKTPTEKLSVGK